MVETRRIYKTRYYRGHGCEHDGEKSANQMISNNISRAIRFAD